MELEVYNINGEKTAKKVNLADDIFNVDPRDHLIYLDVRRYMAHKRQGTHSNKERSQLSGSHSKIKRQKGTGTARSGDIKSPIFRGGARAFGPHPHSYKIKLNDKMKVLARKSALTYKQKDEEIIVLEDFSFENPSTKEYAGMLKSLEIENAKTLLVVKEYDKNLMLSSRNIQKAGIITADQLNTYSILNAGKLIFTESGVAALEEIFNKKKAKTV